MAQYKSINELREALESLGESKTDSSKRIKDEETSKIYESDKFLVLMPHSTESSCLWGKGTTWCTAATQSGNMFLNYTAKPNKNVVLYYIINKESDPRIDPNAKLSLGFIDGKPVLNGENGGVSVNAQNDGITERDLRKILGEEEYNHILNLLKIHNESIKGKHPSKEEMKNLALDYDGFVKKLNSFGDNEEFKKDFISIIARQENINEKILELLSKNEEWPIREFVAKKLGIPVSILERLSNDKIESVRATVAENLSTPVSILEKLSNDKDYSVLGSVAENRNTPEYILEKLSNDINNTVRMSVAQNANTPIHILEKLSNDKESTVRMYVAKNTSTPVSILNKLSKDKDYIVSYYVFQNLNWIKSRK